MTERQILKKIDTALTRLKRGDLKGVVNILLELKHRLKEELDKKEAKKEYGNQLRHLMGWYLDLWDGKPPEMLRFMNPNQIIGKHLKELIAIYEQNGEDIEKLKKDYEEFRRTWKTGDKGILHFRSALPQIKQKRKGFYMSPEFRRGTEYYLKQLKEEEEVFDEDDQRTW